MSSEQQRLAMLRRLFGASSDDVLVGVGDDAAVLQAQGRAWVCSVDAAVEHVHFERHWLSFEQLGYRSTVAALSDLSAMGARPRGVLASLELDESITDEQLEAMARGQKRAAKLVGATVCGGNLARGQRLSIHTTVFGESEAVVCRDGAQQGDGVFVSGTPGLAAAGLSFLLRSSSAEAAPASLERALSAWRTPRPNHKEGLEMARLAHAAMDVSDGLSLDALRLAVASDLDVVLDAASLVCSELTEAAAAVEADALELALHGGEDYGLLVTAPDQARLEGFRRIGRTRPASDGRAGLWLKQFGECKRVEARAFDHFDGSLSGE